jgi:hypothetical protein
MNDKDFIVNLTPTSLQFLRLPKDYDKRIRCGTLLFEYDNWQVLSCSCPEIVFKNGLLLGYNELFLPGANRNRDNSILPIRNKDVHPEILKVLHMFCCKYGYNFINLHEGVVRL